MTTMTTGYRTGIEQAAAALKGVSRVVIVSHSNPDGDAVGSSLGLAFALQALGKRAEVVLRDGVPRMYAWMPGTMSVLRALPADLAPEALVVLDCGDMERTGLTLEEVGDPPLRLNIDHHVTNGGTFATLKVVDPDAPATGLLVEELLRAMGAFLPPEAATALYVALHADTGGFRFANTTPEAFRLAAVLTEAGADPSLVNMLLTERERPEKLKLLGLALSTLTLTGCGRLAHLTVSSEMHRQAGTTDEDTDGLVNYPRSVEGVEVGVIFKELPENRWRLGFRSRGRVDVAAVAQKFGGGGHKNAAGATFAGTLETVRDAVMAELLAALPPC